jgi:PRTRC genetic system protein B
MSTEPLINLPSPSGAQRAAEPTLAVLFHTRCADYGSGYRELAYVTRHPVLARRGGHEIGPGAAVSETDEQGIVALLNGRKPGSQVRQWLPEHLLATSPEATAWWMPSKARPMPLADGAKRTVAQPIWPALLCVATSRGLSIAALRDDERPTPDTPLCHAPLGNVYADGRVCTGNATLPPGWGIEHIEAWTALLEGSAFTHPNHGQVMAGKAHTAASLYDFWSAPIRRRQRLPAAVYVPMGSTAGQFLADAAA